MRRARRVAVGALVVCAACRTAEPVRKVAEPTADEQARALVEQARREVEEAPVAQATSNERLYVPRAGTGKLPLLVFLHGLGGSGAELSHGLRLTELAETLGFAFMAPDGVPDRAGRRFWNATESCCNFDGAEVDHVGLLREWIGGAARAPRVDPARVYIIGFSNGGFMAYRAACELGSLLRGIVSIAGAGLPETARCEPERPLDVVQIHGDRDPIVKFDGGHLFADSRRPRHPSAQASVASWAKRDGCTGELAAVGDLDLDPRVPGAETRVSRYAGCGERRVELWRIAGGDHSAGLSRRSVTAIWELIASSPPASSPPGAPAPGSP